MVKTEFDNFETKNPDFSSELNELYKQLIEVSKNSDNSDLKVEIDSLLIDIKKAESRNDLEKIFSNLEVSKFSEIRDILDKDISVELSDLKNQIVTNNSTKNSSYINQWWSFSEAQLLEEAKKWKLESSRNVQDEIEQASLSWWVFWKIFSYFKTKI